MKPQVAVSVALPAVVLARSDESWGHPDNTSTRPSNRSHDRFRTVASFPRAAGGRQFPHFSAGAASMPVHAPACRNYHRCFSIFNRKRPMSLGKLRTYREKRPPRRNLTANEPPAVGRTGPDFEEKTEKLCNKPLHSASYYTNTQSRGYSYHSTGLAGERRNMRVLVSWACTRGSRAPGRSWGRCLRGSEAEYRYGMAMTVLDGYQQAVTLSGGEDANSVGTGPTIAGANEGTYCSCSSPTVSTATSYGISASVWKGASARPFAVGVPTRRRHQTHDRQQHLRRPL